MIIEFVLTAVIQALKDTLQVASDALPDVTVPSMAGLVHGYTWLNGFLPLSEALDLMRTSVVVVTGVFGMYVVIWALKKLPVVGVKG